jgi:putative transposase
MRRATKGERQGDLFLPEKRKVRRGVKLGRPRKNPMRAGSPHLKRPAHKKQYPVHVVLCVTPAVGSLRKRFMLRALRYATIACALRELAYDDVKGAFRIVHISVQRTHVHLLVEADNKLALSRGMQSFQISAAKHINREYSVKMKLTERRRGNVFVDRFHQEEITTPRQARRALAYVLNNWRKHREDRYEFAKTWSIDPFSSAISFSGWRQVEDSNAVVRWHKPPSYDPLIVYLPKTWLLQKGWQRYGSISVREVPSQRPVASGRAS